MTYPLVRELAANGIPVAVTCRVLKIARQPYYRWLATPVTDASLVEAYLANALFDAHRDDPEFGYRFLAHEPRDPAEARGERRWGGCALPKGGGGGAARSAAGSERTPARRSTTTWSNGT